MDTDYTAAYATDDIVESRAERAAATYYLHASSAERESAAGTVCGSIDPDELARHMVAILYGDTEERIKATAALRALVNAQVNEEAMPKLRRDARDELAERVGDAWVDQELRA